MIRLAKYVSDSVSGAVSDHVSASDWVSLAQSNSLVWTLMAVSAVVLMRNMKSMRVVRLAKGSGRR